MPSKAPKKSKLGIGKAFEVNKVYFGHKPMASDEPVSHNIELIVP